MKGPAVNKGAREDTRALKRGVQMEQLQSMAAEDPLALQGENNSATYQLCPMSDPVAQAASSAAGTQPRTVPSNHEA